MAKTQKQRTHCLVLLLAVMMTTVAWPTVTGQIIFSDEDAGRFVDNLSTKGIQLLLLWRDRFLASMGQINSTLTQVENSLDTDYAVGNIPNISETVQSQLDNVDTKLDNVANLTERLNLTDQGDALTAFMKEGSSVSVNVGGAYDQYNRASGTFTAPQAGLYQVLVRTTTGYGIAIDIMRNGNITLSSLSSSGYYDIKTRIAIAYLNAGDEIFTTGSNPYYFGAFRLRVQSLPPDVNV